MKIVVDFSGQIVGPRGEDIPVEGEAQLTLGHVTVNALSGGSQEDKRDGVQKARDWKLTLKIVGKEANEYNSVELNDKQRKHLIELIRKSYPAPMISEQAVLLIEPDSDDGDEEEE